MQLVDFLSTIKVTNVKGRMVLRKQLVQEAVDLYAPGFQIARALNTQETDETFIEVDRLLALYLNRNDICIVIKWISGDPEMHYTVIK